MRIFFSLIALLLLQACQTTGGAIPSATIHPITSPITIGNLPVSGAEATQVMRTTIQQGDLNGVMEIKIRSRFSGEVGDKLVRLDMEITDVDVNVDNLNIKQSALENFEAMKGLKIELRYFPHEDRFEIESEGKSVSVNNEQSRAFSKMLKNAIVTGRSINQGDKVFDFDLADFLGDYKSAQSQSWAHGRLVAIAVGHTLYDGRLAIVCKGGGSIVAGKENIKFDTTYYVDVLTGFTLYGETKLDGFGKNNMTIGVTQILKVKI